jgi:hypothetical protein
MSSKKENEGHLIQRVNRYVSTLGKCPVVKGEDRIRPQMLSALPPSMYLTKNNFIFISEILEHVFHVVYQMRPAFVGIQLYPLVFYKAP